MSWRPSDWSPLGLDADPTPGDPVVVRDGGQHYQQVAQALAGSAATLRALNGGATTGSVSVTALLEGCEEVLDDVTRAYDRYRVAGDALVAYAYSLDRVQAATAQALATARVAAEQADSDRRRAASCAASASAASGSGSKTAESDAASWNARAAQAAADAAYQDRVVENQKMVVSQAVADRDTAATWASSQIEEITATDGLNDTWWDDWGAKLVAVIADIAEIVSMIAGILALLVCWIPIVGQALAAALLAVAAIAAVVAALANVVLAATGKKSWTDAVISIVFAVLSCIGLGGLRGALGALKGGAALLRNGAKFAQAGAKIAEGARGLAATVKSLPSKMTSWLVDRMMSGIMAHWSGWQGISAVGRIGEHSAGITKNWMRTKAFSDLAKYRVPDGITDTMVQEVKNYSHLELLPGSREAAQLQDMAEYARQAGRSFELIVRESTTFGPLVQAFISTPGVVVTRMSNISILKNGMREMAHLAGLF